MSEREKTLFNLQLEALAEKMSDRKLEKKDDCSLRFPSITYPKGPFKPYKS